MSDEFNLTLIFLTVIAPVIILIAAFNMPKAPTKSRTRGQRIKSTSDAASNTPSADPRDSHLFTDDNPSTTLQGTGFKDAQTAARTIDIVGKRSLTYQYSVINTMYHRAKTHAHQTAAMREAVEIFQVWMNVTYPAAKEALRLGGFKPILSKEIVGNLRGAMVAKGLQAQDLRFVDMYVSLGKNLRLANQLVDPKNPGERDWDVERYEALCKLVTEAQETTRGWKHEELWEDNGTPTKKHLKLIAWGWSPVASRTMASKFGSK